VNIAICAGAIPECLAIGVGLMQLSDDRFGGPKGYWIFVRPSIHQKRLYGGPQLCQAVLFAGPLHVVFEKTKANPDVNQIFEFEFKAVSVKKGNRKKELVRKRSSRTELTGINDGFRCHFERRSMLGKEAETRLY
jgi:hypothetical protein